MKTKIERINSEAFVVAKLPDGSMALFHRETNTVYSLNTTATAAWEACSAPVEISGVVEAMRASLGAGVTEDIALESLVQLQRQGLLEINGMPSRSSRRTALATAAGILAPVVLAMTGAEQKAYADSAMSMTTTTPMPTTTAMHTTATTAAPPTTTVTTAMPATTTPSMTTTTTTPGP